MSEEYETQRMEFHRILNEERSHIELLQSKLEDMHAAKEKTDESHEAKKIKHIDTTSFFKSAGLSSWTKSLFKKKKSEEDIEFPIINSPKFIPPLEEPAYHYDSTDMQQKIKKSIPISPLTPATYTSKNKIKHDFDNTSTITSQHQNILQTSTSLTYFGFPGARSREEARTALEWTHQMIPNWAQQHRSKNVHSLLNKKGIPNCVRAAVWEAALGFDPMKVNSAVFFSNLMRRVAAMRGYLIVESARYVKEVYGSYDTSVSPDILNKRDASSIVNELSGKIPNSVPLNSMASPTHIEYSKDTVVDQSERSNNKYSNSDNQRPNDRNCRRCRKLILFPSLPNDLILEEIQKQVSSSESKALSVPFACTCDPVIDSTSTVQAFELICLDLPRTLPRLGLHGNDPAFKETLRTLLEAFVVMRPDIGYVQGMAHLAAIFLIVFGVNELVSALSVFSNFILTKRTFLSFFMFEMDTLDIYFRTFDLLLEEKCPEVLSQLQASGISSESFLVDWFFTAFTRCLPVALVLQIWDRLLIRGDSVLIETAVALVCELKPLIEKNGVEAFLQAISSGSATIHGLVASDHADNNTSPNVLRNSYHIDTPIGGAGDGVNVNDSHASLGQNVSDNTICEDYSNFLERMAALNLTKSKVEAAMCLANKALKMAQKKRDTSESTAFHNKDHNGNRRNDNSYKQNNASPIHVSKSALVVDELADLMGVQSSSNLSDRLGSSQSSEQDVVERKHRFGRHQNVILQQKRQQKIIDDAQKIKVSPLLEAAQRAWRAEEDEDENNIFGLFHRNSSQRSQKKSNNYDDHPDQNNDLEDNDLDDHKLTDYENTPTGMAGF